MTLLRRVMLLVVAMVAVMALAVGPVYAAATDHERTPLVENQRDALGLVLLTFFVVAGGAAYANSRRQMKGERPQASGEFRWR
jgi:p-aminobenzoyl-glutamate transporter AbgT